MLSQGNQSPYWTGTVDLKQPVEEQERNLCRAELPTAQYTDFSKDVIGRYVCNGLDEALRSTSGRPDARPSTL